jgi:hypothetical protein
LGDFVMRSNLLRLAGLLVVLAVARIACAATLTPEGLQRLLRSRPPHSVTFVEQRESPWLSAPVSSRGTLRMTGTALEKHVESPRQEDWRMLPDRLQWSGPGGAHKEILFSQVPALAPLSDVMRNVVAGELVPLQRDFRIELNGDESAWRALMTPRTPEVSRLLESVELQGTGGQLQVIIIVERGGQRTTTRLGP